MILLEHDAKELLAAEGIPIPAGFLASTSIVVPPAAVSGPWVVKAQVPVGGRGKAGGVKRAATPSELQSALDHILAMTIKGQIVRSCRVEQTVQGTECYLSFSWISRADTLSCLHANAALTLKRRAKKAG